MGDGPNPEGVPRLELLLCALCGRLSVGKGLVDLHSLVGAAMCPPSCAAFFIAAGHSSSSLPRRSWLFC